MNKISVITINLNNKTGLQKTIESLLSQSFKDFELIVIDGGSTDGSLDIINGYSENLKYWVSEKDNGIYHAMNKGISKSLGEYCFFLNSGDNLCDNSVFDKVFKKNPDEDILFGNLYITLKGKVIGKAFGKEDLSFSDIYSNTIKHQAAFIKRSVFDSFGMYNETRKIVADWEFFIKTVGFGSVSNRYINEFISCFDNEGLSNQNNEFVKKEREQVIHETIPLMMQADYEFLFKYSKYKNVFYNKFAFYIVRLTNKLFCR